METEKTTELTKETNNENLKGQTDDSPVNECADRTANSATESEKIGSIFKDIAKAFPVACKKHLKKAFSTGNIITFAICAVIIISGRTLNLVRVVGDSMSPTYKNGALLSTGKNDVNDDSDISYDDVVVCEFSDNPDVLEKLGGHMIIKRVVGLPGDKVQVLDGVLYRNGEAIIDDFEKITDPGLVEYPVKLGANEFFVIGDNRNNSCDSRHIGAVMESEITSIVRFCLLP